MLAAVKINTDVDSAFDIYLEETQALIVDNLMAGSPGFNWFASLIKSTVAWQFSKAFEWGSTVGFK